MSSTEAALMRVVLCHGVFDPFHVGHLYHLQAAKSLGDRLVVAVTQDEFVDKGPGRPVFNEFQRANVVAALRCVDSYTFARNSLVALKDIKPDIFVKGIEYKGKIRPEDQAYCDEHGIEIAFTDTPKFSSTALLHHYDRLRQG